MWFIGWVYDNMLIINGSNFSGKPFYASESNAHMDAETGNGEISGKFSNAVFGLIFVACENRSKHENHTDGRPRISDPADTG